MTGFPPSPDEPLSSVPLDAAEIRRRAVRGGILLAARGLVVRLAGLIGFIVLARLLSPRDFGLLALGLGLVFIAGFLADAGTGAALLRSPQRPTRELLRSVLGLQLLIASAIALATLAASFLVIGDGALVTAIQVASVPLLVFRLPGALLLERELRYREVALTEVVEVLVYTVVAIGLVTLGAGVVGVASAAIVKSVTGVAMIWRFEPEGRLWPSLRLGRVRPLLAFGARFQGSQAVVIGRDQGSAVGVAAIGGLATLGVLSLSNRLLSVPSLVLESMTRVSFPAMARLNEAGEDPRRAVVVGVSFSSIVISGLAVLLAASTPDFLPAVLGNEWNDAQDIVILACLGGVIAGPVSLASVGYLLAVGDVDVALRAVVAQCVTQLVVSLSLLPVIGPLALGLGVFVAMLADYAVLSRRLRQRLALRVLPLVAAGAVSFAAAAGAALVYAQLSGPGITAGIAELTLASAVYCAIMAAIARATVKEVLGSLRRAAGARRASPSTAAMAATEEAPVL